MTKVCMRSLFAGAFLACSLFVCSRFATAALVEKPETKGRYRHVLGKNVERLLGEEAIPALQQGYRDYFFESVAPVIETLNAEKLNSLEELAKEMGVDSLQNEFIKVLIERIKRGDVVPDRINKMDLAVYVARGIETEIRNQLTEIAGRSVMRTSLNLPAHGMPTDDLFWDAHVTSNRLDNLNRLAGYARMIATPHLDRIENLEPERVTKRERKSSTSLETCMKLKQEIFRSYKTLVLNSAEYRLLDLERSVANLKTSDDFSERFIACWTLETSAQLLLEFLDEALPGELESRPQLAADGLAQHVKDLHEEGLSYAEDVVDKANLLRLASFWWLRGRYGSAAMAKGLLKVPAAMNSEERMVGLFMPKVPNKPICSYLPVSDRIEGFDRRNFVTWAVEYRGRYEDSSERTTTDTKQRLDGTNTGETTTTFY